ncbi:hypothetical protein BGW37DRAFT_469038 [Umbelopsis sp. PMI_123]|nr:hypothetical protein BGW37DRAFT_469038 [Umbelopsis sp. PMI_123]
MTDNLNTPEKREETLRWLKRFHSASDALDAATWVQKYFTEDAIVQFEDSPQIYQVARVIYKVTNDPFGEPIVIPGLAVFHKAPEDSKISRFDVYIDISPVIKRKQDVAAAATSQA